MDWPFYSLPENALGMHLEYGFQHIFRKNVDNFLAYKIHKNLLSQKNPMRWLPLILLQQSGTEVRGGEALCSALGCPPLPRSRTPRAQGSTEEPGAGTGHEVQAGTETKLQDRESQLSPGLLESGREMHTLHPRIQPAPDAGRHE